MSHGNCMIHRGKRKRRVGCKTFQTKTKTLSQSTRASVPECASWLSSRPERMCPSTSPRSTRSRPVRVLLLSRLWTCPKTIEIFNLKGVGPTAVDSHMKVLAHTYKLDLLQLQSQWADLYPRAQMEYKEQVGSLNNANDMVRDANKDAWRTAMQRYGTCRSHPCDVLMVALQKYFCCTPSTSGIEQSFSLGQNRYTMQRRSSLPGNEELVLRLIFGLPTQSKADKVEICKLARVAWASQYGFPREHSKPRRDKGIKRIASQAGLSERQFLTRRRSAAAAAAASYSGTVEQVDSEFFTDGHEKEMAFQVKKQQSERIQATFEKSLPEASVEDQQNAKDAEAKFVNNQLKRRAQASRVQKLATHNPRDALLADLSGRKAFLAVSATMDLTAGLANHGLQVTTQASEAHVFVCDKPGEGLPCLLQMMAGLRGLVEASPVFFTSRTGCALKFHRTAKVRKVILVSRICAEKTTHFGLTFEKRFLRDMAGRFTRCKLAQSSSCKPSRDHILNTKRSQ